MQIYTVLQWIFLGFSGAVLLAYDPVLFIVWPIALFGMVYARRVRDDPIIILCSGVPAAVAVGYASLVFSVIAIAILFVLATGSPDLISRKHIASAVLPVVGSLLVVGALPLVHPFTASLLVLSAFAAGAVVLYLMAYSVRRSVRGDQL
ncbi:MAG: hypothetical protein D5R96_04295 [Methanocalculus sp. MSAO_Arc2]|uniref:hypothetical protein n=1 Tax=Methanocalculus sp. MSAO_Arc2 TaxID=2293855 RepID=UPI000FEE204F|nr:MAG: hypothetical protein D5R96_04295 [Methanocalculus sp. MSAO_Arc2]